MDGATIIQTDRLTKRYGQVTAVRDLNPVSYTHLDVYKRQDE